MGLTMVPVQARAIETLIDVLPEGPYERLRAALDDLREVVDGRALWEVNSTACGGGVAEMLQSMQAYMRGSGIDARWAVIGGDEHFFRITKRLHHALHGSHGDGSPLGALERAHYDRVVAANAEELVARVQAGDLVVLHDPQTAGLVPHLKRRHCHVVWRCHIGHDKFDDDVRAGWEFLAEPLQQADRYVFTRDAFVPEVLDRAKCTLITPCIDPLSPKNQPMADGIAKAILVYCGIVEWGTRERPNEELPLTFRREDGSVGRVEARAEVIRMGRAPSLDDPLVTQVSRWDNLKDPVGVMRGFCEALGEGSLAGANLVLAGPNSRAVADDPEGADVFESVLSAWRDLAEGVRSRVHLVNLPMGDREENAAIVNALQTEATLVVQKSLHEGFGLTVTEPMWKSRPVVASAVGGIHDQIEHGVDGLLLDDPHDLHTFGELLRKVLFAPELATKLGANARKKVEEHFLFDLYFRRLTGVLREISEVTPSSAVT